MKKLINDPADVVNEALRGVAAAHPRRSGSTTRQASSIRGRRAGRRARSGSSPAAGPGTSRCTAASSASGMLDAACAGEVFTSPTPDQMLRGDQARRRRRRRAAHREELHRRRHELRDGGRAGRRRDGRRGRVGRHQRRRRRRRTACTPPGAAGSASRSSSRRSRARPPRRGATSPTSPRSRSKVNGDGRSMGMALTSCTVPAAGQADVRPPRDRDRDRHRHPRRARPPPRAARRRPGDRGDAGRARSSATWTSRAATACSRSSTAWAAPRCSSSTSCTARSHAILEQAGVTVARSLVGPYITSLDMAGCSITLAPARRRAAAALGRAGRHRRRCAGEREPWPTAASTSAGLDGVAATAFAELDRRAARTYSPSSTPRSATPTTASTWTAACRRWSRAEIDGGPPAPPASCSSRSA